MLTEKKIEELVADLKFFKIMALTFLIPGIVLGIISTVVYKQKQEFYSTAIPINAVIVDWVVNGHEVTNIPILSYKVNGVVYKTSVGQSKLFAYIGDELPICYNPKNPMEISDGNSEFDKIKLPLILGLLGLPFLVLGIVFVRLWYKLKIELQTR